jgi:sulfur-oxidizing protein SoxY
MTSVARSAQPVAAWCWRLPYVLGVLVGASILVSSLANAEEAQTRWDQIRTSLFADRAVNDGAEVIALETPYRAQDAAVVPIGIHSKMTQTPDRYIQNLYLIIEMNPSPVAAVFHFPGDRPWTSLSTRVRVNAYTDVRVIAETNDGGLFMTSNFVKAAGGCSAPSLKDPTAAAAQLGKMKLVLPQHFDTGSPLSAKLLIKHPNSSGLQFDQVSRQFIPANFVRAIKVSHAGRTLFTVDADISISEDPSITFDLTWQDAGNLEVQVSDSQGRSFSRTFEVGAGG